MSGLADLLDEIDRMEAVAETTQNHLARLDVLADDADPLVAMMARSTRNLARMRARRTAEQGSKRSQGEEVAVIAAPEQAVLTLAVETTEHAPPKSDGAGGGKKAGNPTPEELKCILNRYITRQATHVASHVMGFDAMAEGKFVSYLRVSTDRQGRSGLGLDAQRNAVADFLAGGRWTLVREFVEVESGKRADRPKLAEAMALCRVHGGTLVIAKLDRLSRDAHFLLGLEKAGVDFVAADMPTANRLTVGIMAMVADEERRMISARTKAALAVAKARGTKLGGDRGNFASIAARGRAAGVAARQARASARTADIAPIIAGLQAEGVKSLGQLAAALTERGIPTSRGADRWSPMQVSRVLRAGADGP